MYDTPYIKKIAFRFIKRYDIQWIAAFFLGAEKAAKSKGPSTKTLPELIDEIYQDKILSTAPHWDDGNKIRDGILKRAPVEGE